jgi:hypothetical protein
MLYYIYLLVIIYLLLNYSIYLIYNIFKYFQIFNTFTCKYMYLFLFLSNHFKYHGDTCHNAQAGAIG